MTTEAANSSNESATSDVPHAKWEHVAGPLHLALVDFGDKWYYRVSFLRYIVAQGHLRRTRTARSAARRVTQIAKDKVNTWQVLLTNPDLPVE